MNGVFQIVKRPAPAKKTKGYDVFHVNSTRRVWVGEGRTKAEADAVTRTAVVPTHKARRR